VPWQPDDYIHRIGRTGRAGLTGIAITLATREDRDAVAAIEKLIGHKIARAGAAEEPTTSAEAPKSREAKKPAEATKPRETRKPAPEPREARKSAPEPKSKTQNAPAERSPVVEDMESEWNGPLPSFLSHRAT
jgi:superfamily II DNA/RNA helicase